MGKLTNPVPLFLDAKGALLDAGKIYVGLPNQDPDTSPVQCWLDKDLTLPIDQPLRTQGGVIVNNGNPVFVFTEEEDFSVRIRDADDLLVYYSPSTFLAITEYQPLDADLTAIAALVTTAFGRNLLTLANAPALKTMTGIPDCLPLIGGTVSGNILRSGAGPHLYHSSNLLNSGRVFITAAGAGDPTSIAGDIWLTYT